MSTLDVLGGSKLKSETAVSKDSTGELRIHCFFDGVGVFLAEYMAVCGGGLATTTGEKGGENGG